jgi:hypothetical protein
MTSSTLSAASETGSLPHTAHLDMLVGASRADGQPLRLFEAAEYVAAKAIGYKLFTIMLFDASRFEVERLYSSMPSIYPVAGRKKKESTRWGEHTLRQRKVFRATTFDAIRDMFDDHQTLASIGIGSMLNIPIAYDGRCIGTMNLSHQEGWFTEGHERVGLLIASFLSTPLALMQK